MSATIVLPPFPEGEGGSAPGFACEAEVSIRRRGEDGHRSMHIWRTMLWGPSMEALIDRIAEYETVLRSADIQASDPDRTLDESGWPVAQDSQTTSLRLSEILEVARRHPLSREDLDRALARRSVPPASPEKD